MKNRLKKILTKTLSPEDLADVCNSYDIVGDIAIIRATKESSKSCLAIAEAIMNIHKNVKTVLVQKSAVDGDFRIRKLHHIAGEDKNFTIHRESGCLFLVDVEECYFSPRLLFERMRIAKQVRNGEVVVNMFGGVGCFSIVIAEHSSVGKVYSIDINPAAIQCLEENARLNGVFGKVIPILGDAKEIIKKKLCCVADRVLMPLPTKAFKYLHCALLALKNTGGWIHYYDFEHARKHDNPIEKVSKKVDEKLASLGANFEIPPGRVVRTTGPNWYQVVLDIRVKSHS